MQYPYSPVNVDLDTIATLTAATTGSHSNQFTNSQSVGATLRFYCTAESGTSPTLTFTIQGYDPPSGQYYTVATQAAAFTPAANTMFTLTIYPGATAVSSGDSQIINAVLPLYWRASWAIGGTTPSITGTIGGCTLV